MLERALPLELLECSFCSQRSFFFFSLPLLHFNSGNRVCGCVLSSRTPSSVFCVHPLTVHIKASSLGAWGRGSPGLPGLAPFSACPKKQLPRSLQAYQWESGMWNKAWWSPTGSEWDSSLRHAMGRHSVLSGFNGGSREPGAKTVQIPRRTRPPTSTSDLVKAINAKGP